MLIKAAELEASPLGRQAFNLNDIAVEAEQIIDGARQRRDEMLATVDAQIMGERERASEEGYKSGHEQGLAEGREAGHDEALAQAGKEFAERCEQTYNSLCAVFSEFEQVQDRIIWQAEQDTVELAIAIAEKVIKKAVPGNPAITAENIKAVVKLMVHASDVVVAVNPDDLQYLNDMVNENDGAFGKCQSITFKGDETIAPGGSRVHTEQGGIDGTVETQIERIAEQLLMTGAAARPDAVKPIPDRHDQEPTETD